MAEEVKREREDDSAPADKEQTPKNVEGNDAEADTPTPEVKAIDPEDQTFWEDSVDANAVDISEGETAASDTPPTDEPPAPAEETQQPDGEEKEASTTQTDDADSTSPTPAPPEDEWEDQPEEKEPVAEMDAEQEEPQTEGETATSDTPPTDEPPAPAEQAQQPDGEEKEASTTQTENADSTSPTPATPEGEGEDQPEEQEPVAEKEAGQEEPNAEEDNAAAASDEPQPKGKVLSFYRRLNKKTLIAGSGILLLIAGSIGFTLVPGLRSPDTITSTFLGGMPETAYDMKFFLPLDVGYEKSQFVKVTIALELIDEGLQKEIDKNISQLRKEVIDLILTKSPKEVKSSSGKKELSREITSRINNYLLKDCIKNTYFTELVIL